MIGFFFFVITGSKWKLFRFLSIVWNEETVWMHQCKRAYATQTRQCNWVAPLCPAVSPQSLHFWMRWNKITPNNYKSRKVIVMFSWCDEVIPSSNSAQARWRTERVNTHGLFHERCISMWMFQAIGMKLTMEFCFSRHPRPSRKFSWVHVHFCVRRSGGRRAWEHKKWGARAHVSEFSNYPVPVWQPVV